jgi:hypothetical protein
VLDDVVGNVCQAAAVPWRRRGRGRLRDVHAHALGGLAVGQVLHALPVAIEKLIKGHRAHYRSDGPCEQGPTLLHF